MEPEKEISVDQYARHLPEGQIPSLRNLELAEQHNIPLNLVFKNSNGDIIAKISGSLSIQIMRSLRAGEVSEEELIGDIVEKFNSGIAISEIEFFNPPSGQIRIQCKTAVAGYEYVRTNITNERESAEFELKDSIDRKIAADTFAYNLEGSEDAVVFNERAVESISENIAEDAEGPQKLARKVSEGRLFALKLGRAHRDNNAWKLMVDEYLEKYKSLPAYYEYLAAVYDLLGRVSRGEIKMPESIISYGSGPYQEWLAHDILSKKYDEEKIKPPKVYSLDITFDMLMKGKAKLFDELAFEDVPPGIVADFNAIPFKDESFDMAEFSTMRGVDFSNEHEIAKLESVLSNIMASVKSGGFLRIVNDRKLPDSFYEYFERNGWQILTPRHVALDLSASIYNKIKNEKGGDIAEYIKGKMQNNQEYIFMQKTAPTTGVLTHESHKMLLDLKDDAISQTFKEQFGRENDYENNLNNLTDIIYKVANNELPDFIGEFLPDPGSFNMGKWLKFREILFEAISLSRAKQWFISEGKSQSGTRLEKKYGPYRANQFRESLGDVWKEISDASNQPLLSESECKLIVQKIFNKIGKDKRTKLALAPLSNLESYFSKYFASMPKRKGE